MSRTSRHSFSVLVVNLFQSLVVLAGLVLVIFRFLTRNFLDFISMSLSEEMPFLLQLIINENFDFCWRRFTLTFLLIMTRSLIVAKQLDGLRRHMQQVSVGHDHIVFNKCLSFPKCLAGLILSSAVAVHRPWFVARWTTLSLGK